MNDRSATEPEKSASKTAKDNHEDRDASGTASTNATQRIEKGDPKAKDVNPLAPPINIEAGS